MTTNGKNNQRNLDKQSGNLLRGNPAWHKGMKSANPRGRPRKADCLIDCIKVELARKTADGRTNEELVAAALVKEAATGNARAIEILMSYTTPKPATKIEATGAGGEPIRYEINVKDAETKQLTDTILKGSAVVPNIGLQG